MDGPGCGATLRWPGQRPSLRIAPLRDTPTRAADAQTREGPRQASASWRWLPIALSGGIHSTIVIVLVVLALESGGSVEPSDPLVLSRVEFVDPGAAWADEPLAFTESSQDPRETLAFDVDCTPVPLTPEVEVSLPKLDFDVPDQVGEPLDLVDIPLSAATLRRAPEPARAAPQTPTPRAASAPTPAAPRRAAPKLRLLSRPELARYYPREARRRGLEGEALVQIRVDARGVVVAAAVVRSSGHALLDRQALLVMYAYRFAAGAGGRAQVPVNFRLR